MENEQLPPLPTAVFHILIALAEGDRHGYAIMLDVAERTQGALKMSPGTLYGSIRKLLEQELIEEVTQKRVGDDERRRYYRLSRQGRRVAEAEARRLSELVKYARIQGLLPSRG